MYTFSATSTAPSGSGRRSGKRVYASVESETVNAPTPPLHPLTQSSSFVKTVRQ